MITNRISIAALSLMVTISISACYSQQPDAKNDVDLLTPMPPVTVPPTPTAIMTEPPEVSRRVEFEELGISLEIPSELYVRKDPLVNYDDQSKLDGYLFRIQNYGYPGGPYSGSFQMYGHFQYSLLKTSWEEFSDNQLNSPMNAYANYIEVGGLRGYDTQVAGQRNRYVYHFFLDGYVLTIAVADPTPENKALSDQIIQTLQILPGGLTQESHTQLVTDPNGFYQLLIPDDWVIEFQPTMGSRLTGLEARSPDLEISSIYEGGPHDNVYYKNGIFIQVLVLSDDSALQSPFPDLTRLEYDIMYSGISGREYFYIQPSTVEGEERQLRFFHEGRSYILRFAYAENADRMMIDRILLSFNITPETFFPYQ